jgi:hypothetical protein
MINVTNSLKSNLKNTSFQRGLMIAVPTGFIAFFLPHILIALVAFGVALFLHKTITEKSGKTLN